MGRKNNLPQSSAAGVALRFGLGERERLETERDTSEVATEEN